MRSTISARSTRSCFSTSINRRPLEAYLLSSALIREDLPVPRAPVSSTLLAGSPSTNCRVFCSTRSFWASMPWRSRSAMRCTFRTGSIWPLPLFLRQRKAVEAFQSVGGASCGNSRSSRASTASACLIIFAASFMLILRTIFSIDRHIIVRQIASPYRRRCRAPVERNPHRDLGLLHHARAVRLAVVGAAAAVLRHQHVIEIEIHLVHGKIGDAGVADRRENAPEVRVGGKERCLHQR